jgi:hypothetical protein
VCKVNDSTTFREPLWVPSSKGKWGPQRLPKRRRVIYFAHRAKSPEPKISIHSTVKVQLQNFVFHFVLNCLIQVLASYGLNPLASTLINKLD